MRESKIVDEPIFKLALIIVLKIYFEKFKDILESKD